jgi:hypothetical protein
VLGGSAYRAGADIRRPVGLVAAAVVCVLVVGAPAATAQQRTTTNPAEDLWRDYPLEQTPTTSGGEARPPSSAPSTAPRPAADDDSGLGAWWIAAVAGAAVCALALAAGVRRRRRGPSEAEPGWGAAPEPATDPQAAAAPPARLRPQAAQQPQPAAPPSAPPRPLAVEGPQGPAPPRPADEPQDAAVPQAQPRPAAGRQGRAARSGPVCQVRWNASGGFFYAVTTDASGNEDGIARSPRLDGRGPGPPEQEPEAEVALRVLAKELRDRGWRPLRTKGIDAGERRWYARRFRWPTEAGASTGEQDDAPRSVARMQIKRGEA